MSIEAATLARPPGRPHRALTPARLGLAVGALLGVVLAVVVVGWFGFAKVLSALTAIGWRGFALFVLYSLACFPITGAAWWTLAAGEPLRRLWTFTFGRLLRESASDILPFASIGGVVVGVRGVILGGVGPARAYGSLAADLMTEIVAQIAFLGLGLALLSAHLARNAEARAFELCFLAAMALALLAIGGLIWAQRRGVRLVDRLVERFVPAASAQVQGVREVIADLYRRPWRLLASIALHLGGWISSAVGSWIALSLMGAPLSIPAVIAIESLLSAIKSAAFVAPNAVGVQEAAYALIGQVFGLSGEMGVALSLLRRAKDLALGAPTLLVWQALEGRRLVRTDLTPH
ncbi:lysylphosphatidylglycerol synthase domain-containing protein [Caulobacter sp. S45]|uniref:lysylphosphatidylglycerol synthase domain-containing protein n=1 Tax=Caulobacter sp. S45 TaxID=1641861 RepID=UPI00157610FF|nr:lysylphosphatidylglycerol synthase domain-containing protein [Caulobacter sp. S45]